MSSTTLRTIIAIVFFVHGIGHFQGVLVALGLFSTERWHARSWLFTDLIGDSAARALGFVIWLAGAACAIAAGLSLLGWLVPHPWWRTLSIVFAVVSFAGLILYWHALAMSFNKIGAIAVNLAVLVGLLLLNWPTEADIGF